MLRSIAGVLVLLLALSACTTQQEAYQEVQQLDPILYAELIEEIDDNLGCCGIGRTVVHTSRERGFWGAYDSHRAYTNDETVFRVFNAGDVKGPVEVPNIWLPVRSWLICIHVTNPDPLPSEVFFGQYRNGDFISPYGSTWFNAKGRTECRGEELTPGGGILGAEL